MFTRSKKVAKDEAGSAATASGAYTDLRPARPVVWSLTWNLAPTGSACACTVESHSHQKPTSSPRPQVGDSSSCTKAPALPFAPVVIPLGVVVVTVSVSLRMLYPASPLKLASTMRVILTACSHSTPPPESNTCKSHCG